MKSNDKIFSIIYLSDDKTESFNIHEKISSFFKLLTFQSFYFTSAEDAIFAIEKNNINLIIVNIKTIGLNLSFLYKEALKTNGNIFFLALGKPKQLEQYKNFHVMDFTNYPINNWQELNQCIYEFLPQDLRDTSQLKSMNLAHQKLDQFLLKNNPIVNDDFINKSNNLISILPNNGDESNDELFSQDIQNSKNKFEEAAKISPTQFLSPSSKSKYEKIEWGIFYFLNLASLIIYFFLPLEHHSGYIHKIVYGLTFISSIFIMLQIFLKSIMTKNTLGS